MNPMPFARTIAGNMHDRCEDDSESYALDKGGLVFAVADGHGDAACTRSGRGAQLAVLSALEHLERLNQVLVAADPRTDDELMGALKAQVVATWRDLVVQDLSEHPACEDELSSRERKKHGSARMYLYGTTLVAGLLRERTCYLIQQGDGCCVVVRRDGSIDRPVPDDPRCVGNVTTSMSSAAAAREMRHAVVDAHEVVAIYLASDGIEKSFTDEDAVAGLFDWLVLSCQGLSREEYEDHLEGVLVHLREHGSGDDMSMAGVVDSALDKGQMAMLERASHYHNLVHNLSEARAKRMSMQRKHDSLQKMWAEGRYDEAAEYPSYHEAFEEQEQLVARFEGEVAALGSGGEDWLGESEYASDREEPALASVAERLAGDDEMTTLIEAHQLARTINFEASHETNNVPTGEHPPKLVRKPRKHGQPKHARHSSAVGTQDKSYVILFILLACALLVAIAGAFFMLF